MQKNKIDELQAEIEKLKASPGGNASAVPNSYKEQMELRLSETMAEAKRHYQSYVDIRSQYNSFVEGRINQMVDHCKNNPSKDTPGMNSIKSQKAKADIIQTLKVNLEAQDEALAQEIHS